MAETTGALDNLLTLDENDKSFKDDNHIKEKENYSSNNKSSLSLIEKEIIRPLERNNKMIKNITQLVAVNHGAYG